MIHYFRERGHRADLDAIGGRANSAQFLDSAQIDHSLRLFNSILEPVQAIESSGQHPRVASVLFEKLLSIGNRAWLIQLESSHYISYESHKSPSNLTAAHLIRGSNMGHQRMLHRPACFEGCQNRVGVHRSALKNLVPERIRERVQNRSAAASNRWLTHAPGAHGCLRVWNIQRAPLHVDGNIENRRRVVLVEAFGNHLPIMWIEDPLLANRMANAERRTAEHLATERPGMNHCSYIRGGEKIHDVVFAGFDVDFNFGKTGDVGKRGAVTGIVVFR